MSKMALTRLTGKAYSPMVLRKVTKFGFPIYVGIITDDNLDTLDEVIVNFVENNIEAWETDSIQDKRNLAGGLVEALCDAFPRTEGAAVVLYVDKTAISSLRGDFMNHHQCRLELYSLLIMGTNV